MLHNFELFDVRTLNIAASSNAEPAHGLSPSQPAFGASRKVTQPAAPLMNLSLPLLRLLETAAVGFVLPDHVLRLLHAFGSDTCTQRARTGFTLRL